MVELTLKTLLVLLIIQILENINTDGFKFSCTFSIITIWFSLFVSIQSIVKLETIIFDYF